MRSEEREPLLPAEGTRRDRRRAFRRGGWLAIGAIAVIMLLVAAVPLPSGVPGGSVGPPPSSGSPPSSSNTTYPPDQNAGAPVLGACNSVGTRTPSALLLPIPNPSGAAPTGARITATYAFGVVGSHPNATGASIYFPSLFAAFPLSAGGAISIYFPPTVQAVAGPGWSSPPSANRSVNLSAPVTFGASSALLSTQKLAVMASVEYGNLTLEVRWRWTVSDPTGNSTSSAWSPTTAASGWPTFLPSVFYPAAYVQLLRSTPNPVTIGSLFAAEVSGFVPGRSFFLEVEDPVSGAVARGQTTVVPANGSPPFALGILLLNYDDYLYPGSYLVHVHDRCGALLASLSINAVYASSASVGFQIDPASCGPVTFNGSLYGSGTQAVVVPSATPYAFSIRDCGGAPTNWTTSGGVHVGNGGRLLVSASGTIAIRYT